MKLKTFVMKIDIRVPDGVSGKWAVQSFSITPQEASKSRIHYGGRAPAAGNYKRLMLGNEVVMSNVRAEIRDHLSFIQRAKGTVLINGLGLGMCIEAIMNRPEVEKIIVIEKDPDVIKLVASTYATCKKVEIIQSCALAYQPPKGIRFGAVWHDIWTFICSDNLEEMRKLHTKYGRIADWQDSWCKSECLRKRKQEAAY